MDGTGPDEGPEDYEALLWAFLDRAAEEWTPLELDDDTATRRGAFMRLVRSGQVQLRLRVLARGRAAEPKVRATCMVTGDYRRPLVAAVSQAVPEFGGHVIARPESAEYRLSTAGRKTRSEIRRFGGGQFEENFLADSLQFAIPGVVSISDLEYLPTTAVTAAPSTEMTNEAQNGGKPKKAYAWPVRKTEGHVAAHLAAHKSEYVRLARDVLDERSGAQLEFEKTFGATPIARAITQRVGTKHQRACGRRDVHKTETYTGLIQPLLRKPPDKPEGWERYVEEHLGERLPDILDEIEFDEDEMPLEDEDL
jgi:hypothetical protein